MLIGNTISEENALVYEIWLVCDPLLQVVLLSHFLLEEFKVLNTLPSLRCDLTNIMQLIEDLLIIGKQDDISHSEEALAVSGFAIV